VIDRLVVVGLGLLGGSVAKGARARGLAREIVGVGREAQRLRPALEDGTVDRGLTDAAAALRGAELVVLAAPVRANEELLAECWPALPAECVVTDVGSTKRSIMTLARRLSATLPRAFVGSHPMAGSERTGYGAARADLFAGATVVVTPPDRDVGGATKRVTAFWEALGAARVVFLDPETHDRAVAAVSHLPHLVACALVAAVEQFDREAFGLAAGGFRDTTRIAAGDPAVWEEIFVSNRDALDEALRAFEAALGELREAIRHGGGERLRQALAHIKARREMLR
jgi:prephenate dehydrogenase